MGSIQEIEMPSIPADTQEIPRVPGTETTAIQKSGSNSTEENKAEKIRLTIESTNGAKRMIAQLPTVLPFYEVFKVYSQLKPATDYSQFAKVLAAGFDTTLIKNLDELKLRDNDRIILHESTALYDTKKNELWLSPKLAFHFSRREYKNLSKGNITAPEESPAPAPTPEPASTSVKQSLEWIADINYQRNIEDIDIFSDE